MKGYQKKTDSTADEMGDDKGVHLVKDVLMCEVEEV
jgi:hypothetical protein